MTKGAERTRWKIRSDRVVDENPRIRLSIASLELADGTVFCQYVMRLPRCAMTVVLDDSAERVLLIWRHRVILDRWLWELPGGYIDPGEDDIAAAARNQAWSDPLVAGRRGASQMMSSCGRPGIAAGPLLIQAVHEYVPGRNFLTFLAPHTYSRHTRTARCPGVKTHGAREAAAWIRSAGRR